MAIQNFDAVLSSPSPWQPIKKMVERAGGEITDGGLDTLRLADIKKLPKREVLGYRFTVDGQEFVIVSLD